MAWAVALAVAFALSPAAAQALDPLGSLWDEAPSQDRPDEADDSIMREELPSSAFEGPARDVEREQLDPVMAADGSGLPHELWSGLSAEDLAKAIATLELPPRSPTLNALWRRLLGADSTPADGVANARFTALRVEALDQSGFIDEVAGVLAQEPAAPSDPLLMALTAKSEIGLGNVERGCEIGKGLITAQAGLPKPLQADAILINGYCAGTRGDMESASLQASLLRELDLGLVGADFLDQVASGVTPAIPKGEKLTLLDYRIAALKGGFDRGKLIAAASPALLSGLAHDPRTAPDVRLAAGEAAAAINAIPASDLAALYMADGAGADAGTIERAGLYKSAEAERTPLRKARLIRAFLDEARRIGIYPSALRLMAEATRGLEPVAEIGWFADTAVEVNLAAGNFEGARAWARLDAPVGASEASSVAHWMALIDIADPATRGDSGGLAAVEAMARNGRFDGALLHRLATVLDALQLPVPGAIWDLAGRAPQPPGGHLPDTGVLSELADASQKKEFGRTVLLVMRTIGPKGAASAHMIALGDSLRALKRAGLEAEARQLAVEGLFDAWPRTVSQ